MTDLSWTADWTCTNIIDDYIGPCHYEITLTFDMNAESILEQTVAFGRIRSLIKEIYQDSVFISMDNPLLPILKNKTKQLITTFPMNATDAVICAITWYKINAICEGRITLTGLSLSCDQSEDLVIHFDEDFAESNTVMEDLNLGEWEEQPWWFRETPAVGDWAQVTKKGKKIIIEDGRWLDYLKWDQHLVEEKTSKYENNIVPLRPKWKPEVIVGDKPKD
jgi:hypothetical protein